MNIVKPVKAKSPVRNQLIAMTSATILFAAIAVSLTAIYAWFRYNLSYWIRNNVPSVEGIPLVGSMMSLATCSTSPGQAFRQFYDHPNAKDQPIIGFYVLHRKALLIREPELIKQILVKDFTKFSNRVGKPGDHDLLGKNNLFFVRNPEWREIRTKLTPVFTSGKLKQMLPLIVEKGQELDSFLQSQVVDAKTNSFEIEIKDISSAFTNDVIASVAFGVQVNSFKNPKNDFRVNGQKIVNFTAYRAIEFFSIFFMPTLTKLLRSRVFSQESSNFLHRSISYVMEERSKSGLKRNDLIDVLLAFKKEAKIDIEKARFGSDDFLIAQAAIFFSAGFETSSAVIAFALYELAKNQEIHDQLRDEIREAMKDTGGVLTFDMIQNMKLLNAIISETLRMYPSVPLIERECTLLPTETGYSLKPYSEFSIPNGMSVYISNWALQRDPKYFPDPDAFIPGRFLGENRAKINPYTYLPFGTGPHNCIGDRLGLLQASVGIISYLLNHRVEISPKTSPNVVFNPKSFPLQSIDGIYVNLIRDPL